jgi:toxin ParE1/3/4
MPRHKFTAHAQKDLLNIINYTVQNWGGVQADKYIDGLEVLAGNLANNPALGTCRDVLKKGLFSFPYQSHMLYYIRTKTGIIILRVLHQHQNLEKNL